MKKLTKLLLPLLFLGLLGTSEIVRPTQVIAEVYQGGYVEENKNDCEVNTEESNKSSSESSDVSTSSSDALANDPFTKGTQANKTAEKVFKAFIDRGTSGAFAAGVVGWVNSEGGFAMIGRAEGHYGNDLKTNSIAYGVVPSGLSYYTTAAGGGIFQFTPYTKYAPLGSPDWEDADKMIAFVIKSVASGDWNASMDLTGKNHSFQEAVKLTDPQEATLTWQSYERGSVAHINQAQKKSDAQKAYDVFEGSKYKYDEAKFKKAFGSTSSDSSSDSSSSDNKDSSKSDSSSDEDCETEDKSSDSSGGTADWNTKGGSVSLKNGNAWRASELPNELKKYALDPKSLGMGFRDKKGWNAIAWSGGQCTDLSASLMYNLWEKDGKHPTQTKGNGSDVVANWVSSFGGKQSEASSGAVFSQTPASAGGAAGHTGVVSHVFENGDILVVEQNYSTLSGENKGFGQYTWNYRYVSKSEISGGYTFYSPSQSGYKLSSSAKSVG